MTNDNLTGWLAVLFAVTGLFFLSIGIRDWLNKRRLDKYRLIHRLNQEDFYSNHVSLRRDK